jgi:hypothetical protein
VSGWEDVEGKSTEREKMRVRTKHVATIVVLAAAGLATFAATGLGRGGESAPRLEVVDPVEMKTVKSERLPPASAAARGLAVASKKIKFALEASYLVGTTDVPVSPNGGALIPLTCPGKTIPVSGGMQNNFVALVQNSSSQSTTAAGAPPADWYVGVTNTNNAGAPLTFKPTLVCVRLKK